MVNGTIQPPDVSSVPGTGIYVNTNIVAMPLTPEPFEVWHVSCSVYNGYAKVRNFPSLAGEFIRTFPAGTNLYVYESRVDSTGRIWKRVTEYESSIFSTYLQTLWVAQTGNGSTDTILQMGIATPCAQLTPIPGVAITPEPTSTALKPILAPHTNCVRTYCPLIASSSDHDVVTFVLGCESGNDLPEAIDIAYDIRNRIKSGYYAGTARQVVSQSGQFQPYRDGCDNSTFDPNIGLLADRLISDPNNLPILSFGQLGFASPSLDKVRGNGLYFIGIAANSSPAPQPSDVIALIKAQNPLCKIPQPDVYIGYSPFGVNLPGNTTVHLSDDPQCDPPTPTP